MLTTHHIPHVRHPAMGHQAVNGQAKLAPRSKATCNITCTGAQLQFRVLMSLLI
jgi:hypothetical protein